MRCSISTLFKGFSVPSSLAMGLAGLMLAGCSSSIDRFADYPGQTDRTHTASASSRGAASSDDYIESSTLSGAQRRSSGSNPYQAPVYSQVKPYEQDQPYGEPAYDQPAPVDQSRGGTIIVEPGQTLYSIARANGMTVAALASANGIDPPYTVRAGQRIRVPGVDEPRPVAAYAPVNQNFSRSSVHRVESGETLFSLGRTYNMHPYKIADFNGLSHNAILATGQKIRIPGGKSSERIAEEDGPQTIDESREGYADDGSEGKRDLDADSEIAYTPPEDGDYDGSISSENDNQQEEESVEQATNSFRWPVKGRIISKFGAKPGGARNEGINIAVPEGTSVRAADGGVVAYAGNELKGYGNLVLIRHQGGWVTAYAHNRQLLVKRGDTVRRGDIIAKAGQTGSVEAPQLHFELRKGATAVDPLKYLTAAQASY
jgi:murein DD-endopeptidase MepM/ murein hydrolase activator NlpD